MREFDTDTILTIAAFENMTGSEVRDCIREDTIYFLVSEGKAALAIGKEGKKIKTAEKKLQRQIKIYEYSQDPEKFVKNLIPQATKIQINGEKVMVNISTKDRGIVIGKGGNNIKIIRILLERNSPVRELKVL